MLELDSQGFDALGFSVVSQTVLLRDHSGQAFGSDKLPGLGLELDDFDENYFDMSAAVPNSVGSFKFGGALDSLDVVPEPSTCLLLLAASAFIFRRR